jgi:transglutaminase-like putative cysteine protease
MRTWIAALLMVVACAPAALARTWTDSTAAHTIDAEFVDFKAGKVRLKKADGKIVTVAIERLSKADQAFVLEQSASRTGGTAPSNDDLVRLFDSAGRPVHHAFAAHAKGHAMDLAVGQDCYFVLIRSAGQGQDDCVMVLDKTTGLPKATWRLGGSGACAVALEANALWVLSGNRKRFLRCYNMQGAPVRTAAIDKLPSGNLCGFALAGGKLYFAVGKDDKSVLVEMDRQTRTCRTLREIPGWLPSLTWRRGQLWGWYNEKSAGGETRWLFSLDPARGESFQQWKALSSSPRGLGSDELMFYALAQTKDGFQITPFAVWPAPRLVIGAPVTRRVTFGKRFVEKSGGTFHLTGFMAQPEDKPFQKVGQVRWRVRPGRILADLWGNHWAQFDLPAVRREQEISATFITTNWPVQFQVDRSQKFNRGKVPADILRTYTRETFCFDFSSGQVRALVRKVPAASTWWDKILAARNVVNDSLKIVGPSGPWTKASQILEKGVGRCYAHTVVFCTLGRAVGLPIRAIGGVCIGTDQDKEFPPGTDLAVHTWNQIFIPGQGWVDFDATNDDVAEGPPYPLRHAGCHPGHFWLTFMGDYDKADHQHVFTQRGWIESTHCSSLDPRRKVSVETSTIIRVKTLTPD